MKKQKAQIFLQSPQGKIEEEINIEQKNHLYYFSLKDRSSNRFSREEEIFTRETNELLLELNFRNTQESFLYLKKEKLNYNLVLIVKNKMITPTKIEINYLLNEEEFFLKLKLEGEQN